MSLSINTQIGHYQVIRHLGEGGMGSVFLAVDGRLDRKVALKVLNAGAKDAQQLLNEAKILAKVNHANVLSLYDIIEYEGNSILVTEYLPNQTLANALSSVPPALDEALDIAIALANGLDAIHSKQIIHRDLKLANIFLGFDRTVKIGDFGIAQPSKDSDIESGKVKGTLWAVSPEQLGGDQASFQSDIYSLGLILFQLFMSKHPYAEFNDDESLTNAIVKGKLPKPNTSIPELNQLINEALHTNPKARIATALEVSQRLQKIRQQRTLSELTGNIPTGAKRTKRSLVVSALCIALAGVVSAGYWQLSKPTPPKRTGIIVDQVIASHLNAQDQQQLGAEVAHLVAYALTNTEGLNVHARVDQQALSNRRDYWQSLGMDQGIALSIVCSALTQCEILARVEATDGSLINSSQVSINPQRKRLLSNALNQLMFEIIDGYVPPSEASPLTADDIRFQTDLRRAIDLRESITPEQAMSASDLFLRAPSVDTAIDAINATKRANNDEATDYWLTQYQTASEEMTELSQLLILIASEVTLLRNDTLEPEFARLSQLEANRRPSEVGIIMHARYLWQKDQLPAAYAYLKQYENLGYSWLIDRYLMSVALYGTNDFNAARNHLSKALQAAPENFDLREIQAQLAVILGDVGLLTDAQQFFDAQDNPTEIALFTNLWLAFFQADYSEVLQLINQADLSSIKPWEQRVIQLLQADTLLLLDRTSEAHAIYHELLSHDDLDVSVKAQAIWHTQSADDALIFLSGSTSSELNSYERLPLHYWLYKARNDDRAQRTRDDALAQGIGEVLLDIPWPN